MALFHLTDNALLPVDKTQFENESLRERQDLQRLIKDHIAALGKDLLVIAEEFGEFQESKRRIDLLAVDKQANLVVIELKRTSDGGHMELQAIRYAAMVANMTWDNAVSIYASFIKEGLNAEQELLQFFGWDEPQRDEFALSVRIILAAADFSKEITTSVLWLNQMELDITCIRLNLYKLNGELILNAEQIIPLPEAENYQIELREKRRDVRASQQSSKDRSTYTLSISGETYATGFKKSDIGFNTIKALEDKRLIDQQAFEFLRADRSCSFQLLKNINEITDNEKQYGKYRYRREPELVYGGNGYYVARNWGVGNITAFIDTVKARFPAIDIEKNPIWRKAIRQIGGQNSGQPQRTTRQTANTKQAKQGDIHIFPPLNMTRLRPFLEPTELAGKAPAHYCLSSSGVTKLG